jgi:glutaredoxin
LRVVLYTRRGCHLCADAHQILEEARQQHGFELELVDIDTDPELVDRYGEQVPVVLVDGKLRFRGTVNRVLLERLLGAEAKRAGQDFNSDPSGSET